MKLQRRAMTKPTGQEKSTAGGGSPAYFCSPQPELPFAFAPALGGNQEILSRLISLTKSHSARLILQPEGLAAMDPFIESKLLAERLAATSRPGLATWTVRTDTKARGPGWRHPALRIQLRPSGLTSLRWRSPERLRVVKLPLPIREPQNRQS